MTELRVDLSSPVPVYEQIRSQVAALVAVGALAPGDRLPASRDLARDLGIAVGTAQRAYRELEASGVVTSRRRVGTVVAERLADGRRGVAEPGGQQRRSADGPTSDTGGLVDEARAFVARAREQGLSEEAVLALVRGALLPGQRGG